VPEAVAAAAVDPEAAMKAMQAEYQRLHEAELENLRTRAGGLAFFEAVATGQVETVRKLITEGRVFPDYKESRARGRTTSGQECSIGPWPGEAVGEAFGQVCSGLWPGM